jgi:hypothetical protein
MLLAGLLSFQVKVQVISLTWIIKCNIAFLKQIIDLDTNVQKSAQERQP